MNVNVRMRNPRRELLALAAGGAVCLAVGVLLLAPRVRSALRWTRAATAAVAEARRLEVELAPFRRLADAPPGAGPARIFAGVTAEAAVPGLLDRLSALGRDCALTVTAMSPRTSPPRTLPPAPGAPADDAAARPRILRVLTVAVEAEADFAGLGRYLESLTGLDVPLTVLALEVEPAGRGGGDRVTARFTLGTWVLEEAAVAEVRHEGA